MAAVLLVLSRSQKPLLWQQLLDPPKWVRLSGTLKFIFNVPCGTDALDHEEFFISNDSLQLHAPVYILHCVTCHAWWLHIQSIHFSLVFFLLSILWTNLWLRFCCDSMCALVSVHQYKGVCVSIRNVSMTVPCPDISRQPQLCAKRYCTVGVDSLACVGVWKWHHFVSLVHESGIASPVNSMNYVWQEKVKAMFCIICRLFSKLTFGQPFAGFRRTLGLI